MVFSSDECERANRYAKYQYESFGRAGCHSDAALREICRQLKVAHVAKGGAHPCDASAAPLRSSGTPTLTTVGRTPSQSISSASNQFQVSAENPFLCKSVSAEAEAAPGVPGERLQYAVPALLLPPKKRKRAFGRGGSAELCFVNNKVALHRQTMTREERQRLEIQYRSEFHAGGIALRTRWLNICRAQGCGVVRPFRVAPVNRVRRATTVKRSMLRVWSSGTTGVRAVDNQTAMPLATQTLAHHFKEKFDGKASNVEEVKKDFGSFCEIADDSYVDSLKHGGLPRLQQPMCGCRGDHENVCRFHDVGAAHLPAYDAFSAGLRAWVDSIGRARSDSGREVFMIENKRSCGREARMYFMLGRCMYNPKIQTLIRLRPLAADGSSLTTGAASSSSSSAASAPASMRRRSRRRRRRRHEFQKTSKIRACQSCRSHCVCGLALAGFVA